MFAFLFYKKKKRKKRQKVSKNFNEVLDSIH